MNSLSWMIYLAGVVGNAQILFGMCAGACAMGTIGCWFFGDDDIGNPKLLKYPKLTIPAAFIFAVLAIATPDKSTVYAIAASEYGEEALKTPEASKARQALNAWLDKQIGERSASQEQPE